MLIARPLRTLNIFVLAAALLLLASAWPGTARADLGTTAQFNIAQQPLESAVVQYTEQSGVQITSAADLLKGHKSAAVVGTFSASAALKKLLGGTELGFDVVDPNTVAIRAKGQIHSASSKLLPDSPSTPSSTSPQQLAQVEQGTSSDTPTVKSPENQESKKTKTDQLEEVVVTGTHLRGFSSPSPLISLDQTDILRSGAATTADLMRLVPQNFGGGQNANNNFGAGNSLETGGNTGQTTGVNLRGLGSNATLVLLDGHRLAPSGAAGSVDISAIPLSAVERVDILTDGASAIYGSDAVGGVVNFILKRGYDGAESGAEYGGTTNGGGDESRFDQSIGKSWHGGNALMSYEHFEQTPIWTSSRTYSEDVVPRSTLTPSSDRNSVLGSISENFGTGVNIFAQGLYTHRKAMVVSSILDGTAATINSAENQFSATVGANISLPSSWRSVTSVTAAKDQVSGVFDTLHLSDGSHSVDDLSNANRVVQIEQKFDGDVLTLPAGAIKVAIGGGFRSEHAEIDLPTKDRHVRYVFSEVGIPLVSRESAGALVQSLALNLEGRYESYNDFGTAFTPKLGITYEPLSDLRFRGTWGKSFHAPDQNQLYGSNAAFFLGVPVGLAPGAPFNALYISGGNPDLKPERSKSYTLGADVGPQLIEGTALSLSYYNIDYKDRILVPGTDLFAVYTDPSLTPFVTANPSSSTLTSLAAPPTSFFDLTGGAPLSSAQYLIDLRNHNAARLEDNGVDILLHWQRLTSVGALNVSLDANRLLTYKIQNLPQTPFVAQNDVIFFLPSLKVRGGPTLTTGNWTVLTFLNYTHGYVNNTVTPDEPVASWTTVDSQLAYEVPRFGYGLFGGAVLRLSISNVFDRDPPFAHLSNPVGYDTANADPRGRFISVSFSKSW